MENFSNRELKFSSYFFLALHGDLPIKQTNV